MTSNTAVAEFKGPKSGVIDTVDRALSARDDSYVELTGFIVESLGKERYLFQDPTGKIEIEIEHDEWLGRDVTPKDQIVVRGEVDVEWTSRVVDVESFNIL